MIIDLRRLDEGTGHLDLTNEVTVEDAFGEEKPVPCEIAVDYNRSASSTHLHVVAHGRFHTACHRCLEPVVENIACEFDVAVRRGAEPDNSAEPDYMTIGPTEHEVDVGPILHENVVVNVPMIIVCSEDCRGLCPTCGKNRNRDTCTCENSPDPRWDALRRLGRNE